MTEMLDKVEAKLKASYSMRLGPCARHIAQLAIEAMDEPTREMNEAAWALAEEKNIAFETCTPSMIWQAMIGAARKEP